MGRVGWLNPLSGCVAGFLKGLKPKDHYLGLQRLGGQGPESETLILKRRRASPGSLMES